MSHAKSPWLAAAFASYAALSLVSMATMSLGAALLVVTLLLVLGTGFFGALRAEVGHPVSRLYLQVSLALVCVAVLSLVALEIFPLEIGGRHSEVRWTKDLAKGWYFFWPLLIAAGLRELTAPQRSWVVRGWLAAFALLSVIGIVQFHTGWPRPQAIPGSSPLRFHATLFVGHHLSVASIFIFPFFAALGLAADRERAKELGLDRRLVALAAVLGGLTLFAGYSRMLWIALPIGIALWALWNFRGRARWSLALIFLVALGATSQLPAVQTRMKAFIGITERVNLWEANWELFKERPLLGAGWRHNEESAAHYLMKKFNTSDVFAGHAHNNFLDVLGGTGALGALAWLAWNLAVTLLFWKQARAGGPLGRAIFCAWLVFHLNGLTQVNFWEGKVLHQLMWILGWTLFLAASPRSGTAR